MIEAGGREVRVSSPDRVIFPATERTREVTKLDVAEYYVSVGDGIMRALRERPTTLERWPKGVHRGDRALHARDAAAATRSSRSGCPRARRTTSRPSRSRSRPAATPTRSARPRSRSWPGARTWARSPSTRGRCGATDVDHPDELRIDLDPQPGTDFADAVRVAGVARELLERARLRGFPKTSRRPRRAHLRADRAALDVHRRPARRDRLRPRAGARGCRAGHHQVVEGGARRADLRRLQPERPRPHHRLGLLRPADARRAGVGAGDLGRARRRATRRTSPSRRCRSASPRSATGTRRSTTGAHSLEPLLELYERDESRGRATCPTRPTTRRCPASRRACSRRATGTARRTNPQVRV